MSSYHDNDGKRYPILRVVAMLLSIVAAIIVAVSITLLFDFVGYPGIDNIGPIRWLVSILFIVIAILIYAFSELIYVRLDTEENTRKTYQAVRGLKGELP